jgi:dipeptidyl aminopeptidase/acylaminoacyl peptidase
VQGKTVDARSDIFSFGCILYEAATRRRPFAADSDVEILHKILKDRPPPVEELNPRVPAEVRHLIRRCLAKSPEQRLQSMKDLAIELREIADDYESLSVYPGSTGSTTASGDIAVVGSGSRWRRVAVPAAALLGLAGVSVGAWALFGNRLPGTTRTPAFEAMKVTRIASIPDLSDAVLSPDGRQLAYAKTDSGLSSLWIRQIATGSDLQLLPPQPDLLYGLVLPGDGSYLYYLAEHPAALHLTTMYRVPTLGGPPRKILDNVAYDPTFAPGGREVAIVRGEFRSLKSSLVIASVDGSAAERTLAAADGLEGAITVVAWSPDGRRIAAAAYGKHGGRKLVDRVVIIDVATGAQSPLGSANWFSISGLEWLDDGSGLIVAAREADSGTFQLWSMSYPDGLLRRITNDANSYGRISLSADAQTIAAVQVRYRSTLWSAPAEGIEKATEIGLGALNPRGYGLVTTTDGSLLFGIAEAQRGSLAVLDPSGSVRKLSPETMRVVGRPAIGADGAVFFTADGDDELPHIWSMKLDGTGVRQLTTGSGEGMAALGQGRILMWRLDGAGLWAMPLGGGPMQSIGEEDVGGIAYSPDGRYLAKTRLIEDRMPPRPQLEVARVDTAAAAHVLDFHDRATRWYWMPSSDAISYLINDKGISTLWRAPIDGGKASRLLAFPRGQIGDYAFSRDGRRLFFTKEERTTSDVVLITSFR